MKKILVVLVLLASILSFSVTRVSITSIIEHPALDMIRDGIIDFMSENGFTEDNVKLDFQSAQGSINTAVTIARQFVSDGADVIVGIATPSAQACVNATKDIPVVFAAVTDPVGAGLISVLGKNDSNVVGTSDMTPVTTQLKLLKLCFPDAVKVGVVYNPSEVNSLTTLKFAKDAADSLGLTVVEIAGTNTYEMVTSMNAMIDEVDAIYMGNDNTAASCMENLGTVALRAKVPVVVADITMAQKGGVIGFGFDYYQVGRQTGRMVVEILNGKKPSELESEIVAGDSLTLYVNCDRAEEIGMKIPDKVIEKANMLVKTK